jgi:hypothetical protein
VFKSFFAKKKQPLSGIPSIRRLKTYTAQSGYVYHYFYEGHRDFRAGDDHGLEFVFSISPDRKSWHDTAVLLSAAAVAQWEQSHARELSSTERYAVAKMALFQAFDERPEPVQMKGEVRVRAADIEAIIDNLDL